MLKNRRIYLLLSPILALFMLVGNPNIAIAGDMSHEAALQAEFVENSQSLVVADSVVTPAPTVREGFTVTHIDVVQWPVPSNSRIGNGFGWLSNPCGSCSSFHKGADIFGGNGTPVVPVAPGVVTFAGYNGSMGMEVDVEHTINGVPVTTVYGHLQDGLNVVQGQTVGLGDVLGYVGSTGAATAPLLNFSVYVQGTVVDPVKWIKANANSTLWNL